MFAEIVDILFSRGRFGLLVDGYINTLIITVCSVIFGFIFGVLLAVCKVLPRVRWWQKVLYYIAHVYITVIRGTPVLVQLAILYFGVFYGVDIPPLFVAVIGFGINSSAYVAEIMRGGIMSVAKGQMEAGRSLGMSYGQTMIKIVIPQAVKNILPALGNEVIVLVKETSVASVITVTEFFTATQNITNVSFNFFIPYLFAALVYLATTMILAYLVSLLEKRLRRGDAR